MTMSTDYSADIVVGYVIPLETFLGKFTKKVYATYKKVTKYDTDTGKKLKPQKVVVTPAGLHLEFNGTDYGIIEGTLDDVHPISCDQELWDDLAVVLSCQVGCYGADDGWYVSLQPDEVNVTDGVVTFEQLAAVNDEIVRIGKDCREKLDLDPGTPGVHGILSAY